jgi:hypothetical protein
LLVECGTAAHAWMRRSVKEQHCPAAVLDACRDRHFIALLLALQTAISVRK